MTQQESQAQAITALPVTASTGGLVADSSTVHQFVTFRIDAEEYGVDIMEVREIKGWVPTTSLPNAPHFVCGIINLRGLMVPILDLRARFGKGETTPTKTHVMVIVAVGARTVGVLVDAVSDIVSVTDADIKAAPEMDARPENAYINGLVAIDQRMVALLKLEKLFDLSQLDAADSSSQHSTQH